MREIKTGKNVGWVVFVGLLLIYTNVTTSRADLLISSWHLPLNVRDTVTDTASVEDDTVTLPFSVERTASTLGGTESTVLYDFTVEGDTGAFHWEFDHSRSGAIDSQNLAAGDIFFQVTENSQFNFEGMFSLSGTGRISVGVELRDLTLSGGAEGRIYFSLQQSFNTLNEVFSIGGLGGDETNFLIGTFPGVLVPGHQYLMSYTFDIITPPEGDTGATAHGILDFRITPDRDRDDDGIPDDDDACPDSELSDTVVIAGCDSGVENTLLMGEEFGNGCTIADLIRAIQSCASR